MYRNRKSFFSINVQCLTDANLKFLDVVARWPGSVHDSTIFNNSVIKAKFEDGHFPGCVIIGMLLEYAEVIGKTSMGSKIRTKLT